MKKRSKAKPRYPEGYDTLALLEANHVACSLKFSDPGKFRSAQQFCTRYRLAASFEGINIDGFTRDRTGTAYGALFHVFVCYTALEIMLEAMSRSEKPFVASLTSPADAAAASGVLNVLKSRDFLVRLRNEHDPNKGRTVVTAIDHYLAGGGNLPAVMYAKAIRNAFSHGRLPSAPGNVGADNVIKICRLLCKYLLCLMNKEFKTFMK